jgi:hypothetical protein
MIDLVAVVATVAVWFLIYAMCRVATRPALPPAAPATMDLGPESPALVSFLVGRWAVTEDAAESKSWNSRLRTAVIAEARAAGLSRRRFGRASSPCWCSRPRWPAW